MASLVLIAATALAAPEAQLMDRIVSVVGSDVVTASDLAFEEDLSARLQSPLVVFRGPDALARLEDYRILRRLAGNVELFMPDPVAVEQRLRDVAATFEQRSLYAAFLRGWGLDGHALREELAMRMVCERYVQRNIGLRLPDTEDATWLQAYQSFMEPLRKQVGVRRVSAW